MYTIPQEVLDFCTQYILKQYKISQDQSDGLLIYDDYMNLGYQDFKEVPKELLHFKEIKGGLSFYDCTNLESVENLRNLRRVVGYIYFDRCKNLQSLHGLENLEYVGWSLSVQDCINLQFKGLNPFVNIVGDYGFKIYPEEILQEFEEYVESEQEKIIFRFLESL